MIQLKVTQHQECWKYSVIRKVKEIFLMILLLWIKGKDSISGKCISLLPTTTSIMLCPTMLPTISLIKLIC